MSLSERRGDGCGGNYGDRRRGTRSAIAGEGEGDEGRVSEDERGTWGSRGTPRRLQASAEAGGGRRVAAGTGHALHVLLARGGRLAWSISWAEPGGLDQHR